MAELNRDGLQWDYCQQRISDRGGAGSAEHYAFVWRRSAVECLLSPDGHGGQGYILRGHQDRAAAETFFHRPPMLSLFAVRNASFVFAATVIHVTFDGRENDYAPVKIPARKLEAENLAALACLIQENHEHQIDRVLMFGDYNMPCRPENFESLLGPILGYAPCLDPETCPAPSMLSKVDAIDGEAGADGGMAATLGGKSTKKKRAPIPGDFLWDNIIMSPPLRVAGGADVLASGVCNLVALLEDIAMPMMMGAPLIEDPVKAAVAMHEMKKQLLRATVSDHMPVFADLTTGPRCCDHSGGNSRPPREVKIEVVRLSNGTKLGRQYTSVATHGKKEAQRMAAAIATHADSGL